MRYWEIPCRLKAAICSEKAAFIPPCMRVLDLGAPAYL